MSVEEKRFAVPMDHLPGSFFGPPTLVDLVRHRACHQAKDIAFGYLVDGETELTEMDYFTLDLRARAIAAWLQNNGMAGQMALLLFPPGLDFICAFFGCLYAGVTAVPVYPPRRNRSMLRIESIAKDCNAKVALTTDSVMDLVSELIDETPFLKSLQWFTTNTMEDGMEKKWAMPDIHADTLAFLQYTSGSTGAPKGVVLNHANLIHNSALIAHAFEHTRSGLGVFWLPSYHDMGLIGGVLQPIYVGRPNILMSPMAFLQRPFRWLSAISRFGGTTSGGPNFAYDLCVRKIKPAELEQLDLSSWEVAFNGAEPVRAETIDAFCEKFGPCGFRREAFYPCFGLAEATLIVAGGFVKEKPIIRSFDGDALGKKKVREVANEAVNSRKLVGSGKCLPDETILIVDPDTKITCRENEIGEIWVKSPSCAQGYLNKPEVSEEIFRAKTADTNDSPYMRTGDLGFLHKDELFVSGRIKDMIILHGVNVYPQDVESTSAHSHKELCDEAALFVVEENGRERLVLLQEVERRHDASNEELIAAIRKAISNEHELPLDVVILMKQRGIPKTSSGKIQRHACRDYYLAGTLAELGRWDALKDGLGIAAATKDAQAKAKDASKDEQASADEQARVVPQDDWSEGAEAPELVAAAKAEPQGKKIEQKPLKPKQEEIQAALDANDTKRVAEIVLAQVKAVARERAEFLTMETPITEIGLDSLERMEILASLEETFGGRFPEAVLQDLITANDVVEAIKKYMGAHPRAKQLTASVDEIPESAYKFSAFPEYLKLMKSFEIQAQTGMRNPYFSVHEGIINDKTQINGKDLISFSSYNYIGTSGDPYVVKACQDAAATYGTSVSASRLVSGQKPIHIQLEKGITEFIGTEDTVVMLGGHATNESVIGHLMGPGDLILHDALDHNSILQGAILSGARRRPFPHNNWKIAEELLSHYRNEYKRVLIVVEGVYSMDGDIAPVPELIEIKKKYKSLLMIDEAHSMGTMGATGRGVSEYFGVEPSDVDIWMGTLSKSFGSTGGYISGCKELIQYLRYTAPGFVFSAGLNPPSTASALASLELLKREPQRVQQLHEISAYFLDKAKSYGLNTGTSAGTPVVPVILGNSLHSLQLSNALFKRGVNVQPIMYPAVEESAARLRFFLTSKHTKEEVDYTVETMVEELNKIDPAYVKK